MTRVKYILVSLQVPSSAVSEEKIRQNNSRRPRSSGPRTRQQTIQKTGTATIVPTAPVLREKGIP